jgi:hypothetical protein
MTELNLHELESVTMKSLSLCFARRCQGLSKASPDESRVFMMALLVPLSVT